MSILNHLPFVRKKTHMEMLATEISSRLRDPFEGAYMGILRSADPLARERGAAAKDLYDDLMRDAKVYSSMDKRILTSIARPWQVTPVEDSERGRLDAKTVTNLLEDVGMEQVWRNLMDALLIGMSVCEVIWDYKDGLIAPARITSPSQKRFIYKIVDENKSPELRLLTRQNMLEGEKLPDQKFIAHRVGSFDDNPYGLGLGLQLYWPVFFKRCSMISWNKLNDRFGTPTVWGKYRWGASREEKNTLIDAMRAFSSDGVIMTPDESTIQLIEAAMSGNITSHESLCAYMDNAISAVLTGENSRENSGGAMAAASKERRDIILDLAQSDSNLLCDTLNKTLVKWIFELNGLAPCKLSRPIQEEEDQQRTAQTFQMVHGMGFKPSLSMVKEKFGEGWEEDQNYQRGGSMGSMWSGFDQGSSAGSYNPLSFAEAKAMQQEDADQDLVENEGNNLTPEKFDEAMEGILIPLVEAVEESNSFEEALAALQNKLPETDTNKLQALLSQFMFGAGTAGRGVETKG